MRTRQAKSIRSGILDARKFKYRYNMRKGDLPFFRNLLYERAFLATKKKLKIAKLREKNHESH